MESPEETELTAPALPDLELSLLEEDLEGLTLPREVSYLHFIPQSNSSRVGALKTLFSWKKTLFSAAAAGGGASYPSPAAPPVEAYATGRK